MTTSDTNHVPEGVAADAEILWDFHHLGHQLETCAVGLGLGSPDLEVATFTVELFKRGLFPLIVFSGATSPVTRDRFPHGEALQYRDEALRLGVPEDVIVLETRATSTEENVVFTRELLAQRGIAIDSALFICRPSQERRAYLLAARLWPGPRIICTSPPMTLRDYFVTRGSPKAVIDMLVGDTQRVIADPAVVHGEVSVPESVGGAYQRLIDAGFTSRLMTT